MEELQIGRNAITTILNDYLGVRKVSARWIPQRLSDEQIDTRVEWCKFMLHKFRSGESKAVSKIVTGDESWIYQYDPETKQQYTVWLFPDEVPPKKLSGPGVLESKWSLHLCQKLVILLPSLYWNRRQLRRIGMSMYAYPRSCRSG